MALRREAGGQRDRGLVDERFGADRKVDKLATRYPHGESYLDIMTRLEPYAAHEGTQKLQNPAVSSISSPVVASSCLSL